MFLCIENTSNQAFQRTDGLTRCTGEQKWGILFNGMNVFLNTEGTELHRVGMIDPENAAGCCLILVRKRLSEDLSGIENSFRIEGLLDLPHQLNFNGRSGHLQKIPLEQSYAMFCRDTALVSPDQ